MIFVGRIQIKVVAFVGEMLTIEEDDASTVVIMDSRLLPFRPPVGFHRLWNHPEIGDRSKAQAQSQQSASAQERQVAVVKHVPVQITDADPRGARPHKPVQWLFKKCCYREVDFVRQIASERTLSG